MHGKSFLLAARRGVNSLHSETQSFAVETFWHERFEHDPAHRWLRSVRGRAHSVALRDMGESHAALQAAQVHGYINALEPAFESKYCGR